MRRLFNGLAILLLLAGLVGCGRAAAPAQTQAGAGQTPGAAGEGNSGFTAEYKLYSPTPADHVYTLGAQRFADLIKERTGGRIVITVYPANQLAKGEREALQGLQQETIDLYAGSTGPVGNFTASFQMLDVPFLFRDYAHVDQVLDGPIGRSLLDDLEQAQIKGLAFWENGFRNLTNSKRPVRLPEDVKGLKIRTMENKVHIEAWQALGAIPTPMAWGEVYGALQQKVIDGQENPVAVIYSVKMDEVQDYLSMTRHVYSPAIIAMSLAKFQAMPAADQELFIRTAAEVAAYERQLGRENEGKWLDELRQRGMQVIDQVDAAAWQAAMQPVFAKYSQQFDQRFQQIVEAR